MKAVHFGAGKIGRGFIADLLHETGYEITFIDVNEPLIQELNTYHNYYLYVIEEDYRRKEINRVSGLSPVTDPEAAVRAIQEADLVTTAVLADNFPKIAGTLAKENIIVRRYDRSRSSEWRIQKDVIQRIGR